MTIVSIHAGRDANLAFTNEEGVKHLDLVGVNSLPAERFVTVLQDLVEKAKVPTDIQGLALGKDSLYVSRFLSRIFNYRSLYFVGHHDAHAGYGFAQSSYEEAIVISFGAGGNDGVTNVFHADGKGINMLHRFPINFGDAYVQMCYPIADIGGMKMESESAGHLPDDTDMCKQLEELAGKGEVVEEWVNTLSRYYISYRYTSSPDKEGFVDFKHRGNRRAMGESIGLDLSINKLEGEVARNFAATNQKVFEDIFIGLMSPILDSYKNLPLILTGGCALNKSLTTRLKKNRAYRDEGKLFIPEDPTDSTLSVGQLNYLSPSKDLYKKVSKI